MAVQTFDNLESMASVRSKINTNFTSLQTEVDAALTTSDIVDNLTSTDTDKSLSANQGKSLQDTKANKSDVLELDNTTSFTPSADHHPSTKKYVDDSVNKPSSTTDNTIARYNGTGGVVQSSSVTIDDSNNLYGGDTVGDLGLAAQRWKDLYLSGGLYLGGVSSSNKLQDYEEGTWTPTLGSNGSRVGTWSSIAGYYFKIGDIVVVQAIIAGSGMRFSSTSGYQLITNLPFSSTSPVSNLFAGSWTGNAVAFSSGGTAYCSGTNIYLHSSNSGQNSSGVTAIGVTVTYFT